MHRESNGRRNPMAEEFPFYLAGEWVKSDQKLEVVYPYTGEVVRYTYKPTRQQVERAIQAAVDAFEVTRRLPTYERAEILSRAALMIKERREELARSITLEAGKPLKDAYFETDRCVLTFQTAAEEAKRIYGEVIPLDLMAYAKNRIGIVRRYPLGPVLAISPFNFPLNLPAHKVAPALAAGNSVVLKPASKTPITWLIMADILDKAGVPKGALSVLPADSATADEMVADERFKLITFTGSSAVGWRIKERSGKKRVLLELGGNAGVIVDQGTDIAYAAKRVTVGGFSYAGQICISVQRTYIHRDIFRQFTDAMISEVKNLKVGDPLDPSTDFGPMIDATVAARTEEWVQEAVREGARVLTGGKAHGALFEPTLLTDVRRESKVCSMEVFAPLVNLFPFDDFKQAVAMVNDTNYGLQAGVFTSHLEHALYAFDELQVGGVVLNDIPTFRIDHMPYGGTKDSGFGREGLRYAIEEMTEMKLLAINRL
jgi:acyl-CoA reductase-like NAD-dependent aldehyde dehydrogenase